jgi:hypothetical protein
VVLLLTPEVQEAAAVSEVAATVQGVAAVAQGVQVHQVVTPEVAEDDSGDFFTFIHFKSIVYEKDTFSGSPHYIPVRDVWTVCG